MLSSCIWIISKALLNLALSNCILNSKYNSENLIKYDFNNASK